MIAACPYCANRIGESDRKHITPVLVRAIGHVDDVRRIPSVAEVMLGRPQGYYAITSCARPECITHAQVVASRRSDRYIAIVESRTPMQASTVNLDTGVVNFDPPVPHHTHELVDTADGQRCMVPGCEFSLSAEPGERKQGGDL